MRASTLRSVIEIQRHTDTRDANSNEPIKTWNPWREVSAGVEHRRGREFFEAGQRFAETVVRFTCRFHETLGVKTSDRIVFEGGNYDIKAILPDRETSDSVIIEAFQVE